MKKKTKQAENISIEEYELEMENPSGGFVPYYTGSEEGAQSKALELKTLGCGGRLKRHNGTPEGEIIEQWASIGRLEQATAQENLSTRKG